MMSGILLATLFAAIAGIVGFAFYLSLKTYGSQALSLRGQLVACNANDEVRFTIAERPRHFFAQHRVVLSAARRSSYRMQDEVRAAA